MTTIDEGFAPLPQLAEPDLDAELDDLADDPTAAGVVVEAEPPPLGRAPAFDFAARAIVPGTAAGPLMTNGRATLAGLIEKCLHTRRGECAAVDPDFGMLVMPEDVLDDGGGFDASAAAEYAAAVREALVRLPRISDVDDLTVECPEPGDALFLAGSLVIDDDDVTDLAVEVPINAGA